MSTAATTIESAPPPAQGSLVRVRNQRWAVSDVRSGPQHQVELNSVEDGRYGETLTVVWEVEVDARVIDTGALPRPDSFDPPAHVAAVLDAARWSSVTSADVNHLQAPFRAGVFIEDYQLEPLARALVAPRVNLLLADDVGLGKTIEAGLVALELLLRHRARSVLIVCPAGLVTKWRDEMAEKFGLDFVVVDAAECARLRRLRGSAANPFRSYPLIIVSLPWLRGPRAQRLLDEVLPDQPDPLHRRFDLLILDEAHHVAPAAPKQVYAVDSQQTKLIQRLSPHCEHRLFLSATPHNGYPESFQALLELVDDQRFARGLPPDEVAQRETVIRRLKRDVRSAGGTSFLERRSLFIEVEYSAAELRMGELLAAYVELRRAQRRSARRTRRIDVMALLLKKRLHSSPAALSATVAVVREGLLRRGGTDSARPSAPDEGEWAEEEWADEYAETFEETETLDADDEQGEVLAVQRATAGESESLDEAVSLLDQLSSAAAPYLHRPDAKAAALIRYLRGVCLAGDLWLNERVVVFTEYRDTQVWLEELLRGEGLTRGGRVGLMYGGMDDQAREELRQQFQSDPSRTKIRILLATDAAAEGIDLHWHCHRLVNYDIPFNPNRLEQRIGRIDRYGQTQTPEVRHFVPVGWQAGDRTAGELDFLSRIARKITQVETDLGSANPVLARAVQRAMLGERVDPDRLTVAPPTARSRRLAADADVRERVARLRAQLDSTVENLQIGPDRVRRLVGTGLRLARQAPLQRALDPDECYDVPPLTGTWVRAVTGLTDPLHPDQQRPITFDQSVARQRREDLVYVHLNHPLVTMASRLLTAASAADSDQLSRVTLVTSSDPELTEPVVIGYLRYLVVGGDSLRLHEEVLHAGGFLRPGGRFARIENLGLLNRWATDALAAERTPGSGAEQEIRAAWSDAEAGLTSALDWRVRTRREQVERSLRQRRDQELARNRDNFERFAAGLRSDLAEPEQPELPLAGAELAQQQRDQLAKADRLAAVPREELDEADRISQRYATLTDHAFPLAVVVVVPGGGV